MRKKALLGFALALGASLTPVAGDVAGAAPGPNGSYGTCVREGTRHNDDFQITADSGVKVWDRDHTPTVCRWEQGWFVFWIQGHKVTRPAWYAEPYCDRYSDAICWT